MTIAAKVFDEIEDILSTMNSACYRPALFEPQKPVLANLGHLDAK